MEVDNKEAAAESDGVAAAVVADHESSKGPNEEGPADNVVDGDAGNNSSTRNNSNDDDAGSNGGTSSRAAPPAVMGPPPPNWVPLQYPAAVMPMPPPYYPPLPYLPYAARHLHHFPSAAAHPPANGRFGSSPSNDGSNRTIWVGDLNPWMDEDYLRSCFAPTGEVSSIKVIRNRHTKSPEGYGFVEFTSHEAAERALHSYSNKEMPNTNQPFRLNWATFSSGDKNPNHHSGGSGGISSDLSIFVGDLASDVTDSLLHDTFAEKYPSVRAAKVVVDANTGCSKGYGFVRFGEEGERTAAMAEMQGVYCSTRPMRIGPATPRKTSSSSSMGYQQYASPAGGGYLNGGSSQSEGESSNTTIFVGGLDPNVSDEELKQPFAPYGEIISVKIPIGKGCGFVQFANRGDAEEALQRLSGATIGRKSVRLAWGRNPANRQSNNENGHNNHQWATQYYGGPYFNGYGYPVMHPPSPHDPYMYAASYGAYPFNGTTNQQQVN